MIQNLKKKLKFLLIYIFIVQFMNCFYNLLDTKKPNNYDTCENKTQLKTKFNASFSILHYDSEKNNDPNQRRNKIDENKVRDRILCSNLFSEVEMGKTKDDYYLEISSNNESVAKPIIQFFKFFTFLSLTLIPGYDEQTQSLSVNLFKDGTFQKRYIAERKLEIYFWFPFIVILNQDSELKKINDLLLADVLEKMKIDLAK